MGNYRKGGKTGSPIKTKEVKNGPVKEKKRVLEERGGTGNFCWKRLRNLKPEFGTLLNQKV